MIILSQALAAFLWTGNTWTTSKTHYLSVIPGKTNAPIVIGLNAAVALGWCPWQAPTSKLQFALSYLLGVRCSAGWDLNSSR
jgi:hypothetical protein